MKRKRLPPQLLWLLLLTGQQTLAQNAFNNATHQLRNSDNTGDSAHQMGTEVLNSTPGIGVTFESGGSFEHIGQFYVAKNGIWNSNQNNSSATAGTDYFGYAPSGIGSNTPYLGVGIKGASSNNGGKGVGRPTFGHLQLNSTGLFPVEGGMFIAHSLTFDANGPSKGSVIITPSSDSPDAVSTSVIFAPDAVVTGTGHTNYINGYASVTGVTKAFILPVGDAEGYPNSLHALTVDTPTLGTVTTRYRHVNEHSADTRGAGIISVSPTGSWPISALDGTRITVSMPDLNLNSTEAATLRLVGWNGSQWIDLSDESATRTYSRGIFLLTGTIRTGITELGIGSTSQVFAGKENSETNKLTVWPNPTQGTIHAQVSLGQSIGQIRVIDLQGRSVLQSSKGASSLDASALSPGQYLVEVLTGQGQTLRKSFVKQP